jgi:hypothetical protein
MVRSYVFIDEGYISIKIDYRSLEDGFSYINLLSSDMKAKRDQMVVIQSDLERT